MAAEPIDKLLELLKDPDGRVRYRAKIELSGDKTDEVIAAVDRLGQTTRQERSAARAPPARSPVGQPAPQRDHAALLERMLGSPDFHARAAATRVLCYWRDRVSDPLGRLKTLAADDHPRVRLEAVRAASFFTVPEAVEVAVDFCRAADRRIFGLRPRRNVKNARSLLEKGDCRGPGRGHDHRRRMRAILLRHISNEQLLKLRRNRDVCLEMLAAARAAGRRPPPGRARDGRVRQRKSSMSSSRRIRSVDQSQSKVDTSVVFDLVRQLTSRNAGELSSARAELEKLATSRPAADSAADRLRLADRRRQVARAGLEVGQPIGRIARRPGRKRAAGGRRQSAGAALPAPRAVVGRLARLALERRQAPSPRPADTCASKCPRRGTLTLGRSRGHQRRSQRGPAGQGDAEEHGQRR